MKIQNKTTRNIKRKKLTSHSTQLRKQPSVTSTYFKYSQEKHRHAVLKKTLLSQATHVSPKSVIHSSYRSKEEELSHDSLLKKTLAPAFLSNTRVDPYICHRVLLKSDSCTRWVRSYRRKVCVRRLFSRIPVTIIISMYSRYIKYTL